MKPTLPFAQYDKDANHLHILHKDIPNSVTNLYTEDFVRQQQAEIEALKVEREIMFGFVKSRGEVGQLIVYKALLEAQEK